MDNSPFSKLPAELRNQIWELAVTNVTHTVRISPRTVIQPSITEVCRQIRKESLSLYYGTNKFVVSIILEDQFEADLVPDGSLKMFVRWLCKLNQHAHSAVNNLTMYVYAKMYYPTPRSLSAIQDWRRLAFFLRRLNYSQTRFQSSVGVRSSRPDWIMTSEDIAQRATAMKEALEGVGLVIENMVW